MTSKQVAFTVALIDVPAVACFALGASLWFGVVPGLLVAVGPWIAVGLLFAANYLKRRRAGAPPLVWGDSFGRADMYTGAAWRLGLIGAAMACAALFFVGAAVGTLVAVGTAGFVASSLVLAAHSD